MARLVAALWPLAAAAASPSVQDLVNQFSATNYQNIVSNKLYTRQGMNRVPLQLGGAQHDLCRDAIYLEFQRAGLAPYHEPFTYVDTTNNTTVNACNIIAVKEGVQNPNNEIYVVGSHYDSKNNPGADDNATGVACQLEMARIFAPHYFAKTIVFAIFDCEERWEAGTNAHRLGSLRYVAQHSTDNIKGMISVDMIGWQATGSQSNSAWVDGRTAMAPIRNDFAHAITNYGGGLYAILRTTSQGDISDHVAFANAGFQACCLIEAYYPSNPNYHTTNDFVEMPGYLDWTYLGKMCRSTIGFYATKLQPVDVTPTVVSLQPGPNGTNLITFSGLPRCQYATELCTNLLFPVWLALGTNTASPADGTFITLDPQAGSRPSAFYRARFVAGYVGNPTNAPAITLQPLSRAVDASQPVSLITAATGQAPLTCQWHRNGSAIPGAGGASYALSSAQPGDAGNYSVVVNNDFGSVTSRVVSLTVYPPQIVVFSDPLDTDTSANWITNRSSSDTRITFNYNYAADGIPPAPHSTGGTTRGVKFEANMTAGITAAVSMSPVGRSFSGDYRLHFDLWINANGPFPVGGNGSSQFVTAGIGTAGNRVQWTRTGSTADGYWFAVDGEGQAYTTSSINDFGAFSGANYSSAASGVYAAGTDSNARDNLSPYYTTAFPGGLTAPALQQSAYPRQTGALAAGAVGFAWRDAIISKRGNIVEWSIDGIKLATFTNATFTASNVFVGYWDPFTSVSDNTALSFGLVDNVRVEVPASR